MLINARLNEKNVSLRFHRTVYILTSTITLVSSDRLAEQEYKRDIYSQILINVATHKQVCHIEQRFGKLLLEYNPIDVNHSKLTSSIVDHSKLNNPIVNDSLNPFN